jgi:hypothetical protein
MMPGTDEADTMNVDSSANNAHTSGLSGARVRRCTAGDIPQRLRAVGGIEHGP